MKTASKGRAALALGLLLCTGAKCATPPPKHTRCVILSGEEQMAHWQASNAMEPPLQFCIDTRLPEGEQEFDLPRSQSAGFICRPPESEQLLEEYIQRLLRDRGKP